jgi:hypothetical protein
MLTILCGICGKKTKLTPLSPPRSISDWDKETKYVRDEVFSCCERIWMYDGNTITKDDIVDDCVIHPVDMGPLNLPPTE